MEGDTLPNALAALARTRERTLVEIDELLAAKDEAVSQESQDQEGDARSTEGRMPRAKAPEGPTP